MEGMTSRSTVKMCKYEKKWINFLTAINIIYTSYIYKKGYLLQIKVKHIKLLVHFTNILLRYKRNFLRI